MALASIYARDGYAGDGHRPPEGSHGEHAARPAMNAVGLWLFFLSETFLFGALLAARFYLAGTDKPEHLNQQLGLAITCVLLASSFTAYSAEVAISKGRRGWAGLMLLATIVLGLVFFGGVVPVLARILFSRLLRWAGGVPPPDDPVFSFFLWWVSETMGVAMAAPVLLLWAPAVETTVRRRWVVTVTLAGAIAGTFVVMGRALTLEHRDVKTAFERRALVLRALLQARGAAIADTVGSLSESGRALLADAETEGLTVWLDDPADSRFVGPVWRSDATSVLSHSDAVFHWESPVALGGRTLTLHVSQALPPRPWQTWVLPGLLLAFSCASVVLLLVTTGRVEVTEAQVRERTAELERALGEVKTLRGLLPVCAGCKRVRDDEGLWRGIEEYLWTHADVMVSHGLCPSCLEKIEEQA